MSVNLNGARRAALAVALGLALLSTACTSTGTPGHNNRPPVEPTATCDSADHLFTDPQLGWSFCYPSTWRYQERDVATCAIGMPENGSCSDSPPGIDLTLDIIDFSKDPNLSGLFGFMIISTYQRQGATTLENWTAQYAPQEQSLQPATWGNAQEAVQDGTTGDRFALTGHQVIELELHSGDGNLDLKGSMGQRLSTWEFTY